MRLWPPGRKRELMIFRNEYCVISCALIEVRHASAVRASNAASVLGSPSWFAAWRTDGVSPDMREMRPSTK